MTHKHNGFTIPRWSLLRSCLSAKVGLLLKPLRPRALLSALDINQPIGFDSAFTATTPLPKPVSTELRQPLDFAEEIMKGMLHIYRTPFSFGDTIPWRQDPASLYEFTDKDKTDFAVGRADIKKVWRLSCGHHLVMLASAYLCTGEQRFAARILADIEDWIHENPPGSVNWWSPMETGLRLSIWSYALLLLREPAVSQPLDRQQRIVHSIVEHVRSILTNLEDAGMHTNHLVGNLAGLYMASAVFNRLPGFQAINSFAQRRLEKELRSQVSNNGVHFEFSTHYHRLVTELFLCPFALARLLNHKPFSNDYIARLKSMCDVLKRMINHSGMLPQIGDNDSEMLFCLAQDPSLNGRNISQFINIADHAIAAPSTTIDAVHLTGLEPLHDDAPCMPHSEGWSSLGRCGWHVWNNDVIHVVAVCGPPGSHGIGAHDHGHVNQVILSVRGVEIIVDPGTGCYTLNPDIRNTLRSARSHSTLFAGVDQCGWRPDAKELFLLRRVWRACARIKGTNELMMTARYRGLTHIRRVVVSANSIDIHDSVNRLLPEARVQWVLHPDAECSRSGPTEYDVRRSQTAIRISTDASCFETPNSPYSDHFGDISETIMLSAPLTTNTCRTTITIQDE